ncbi:hypothetical protein [Gryllotalpicola sp.]|uniref:COG4705 family protein n=1 Tax=Gryllotalpicola sp. TaxID=1932787 RepID=UPI0026333058|nr:hypothetical protein [Gryllotalpicola sp.]
MVSSRQALVRVPDATAQFWVVKLLTTAVGEALSDFLVKTLDPVPVVAATAVLFAAAFAIQFTARRYVPWRYWLFVTLVAVFGTMVADAIHIVLGVPYLVSTIGFAVILAAVFTVWGRTERTLSVHTITTNRRELFYWSAVLATFALGTAFGDLTAVTFGLGYWGSAILFAVLFALPGVGFRWFRLPATAAFWASYVVTRPLGASLADWLGVDHARGGLGVGTLLVSAIGIVVIAGLVAMMSARGTVRAAGPIPEDGGAV